MTNQTTGLISSQAIAHAREVVTLLMKRPITEEIAMQIGDMDGFKNLEIANGEWIGFEQDDYMTGEQHGWLESKILVALATHVLANKLGRVYPGDMDFVLSGNKETLEDKRQPDVSFVSTARLQKTSGYFYGAPDLAVEIVSPTQFRPEFVEKANLYMKYGTQIVWLVFPKKQTIEVHTPDAIPVVYKHDDTLLGGDLLPDFELSVKGIFED
ncbi:MAG: Uma2 family endonuclease [Chloroflexota bacterium]